MPEKKNPCISNQTFNGSINVMLVIWQPNCHCKNL